MAMIVTTDNKAVTVPAEVGIRFWRLLVGELEPTEQETAKLVKIKDIYLNNKNAPESYLQARRDVLAGSYSPESFASTLGMRNV